MQIAVPAKRGSGLIWPFMELKNYLIELDVTIGRLDTQPII